MPSLALLEPTETRRHVEDLENKLEHSAIGEEEGIRQFVEVYQTRVARLSSLKQNLRTALFVAMVVCGNLIGNVLLRAGMRRAPVSFSLSPLPYLQALLNPWVVAGVLLLVLALASQLALLSWADLSYVTPVTSIGYVLTPLAGTLFLHEPLSSARWGAIFLIMAGVIVVSRTPVSTAGGKLYGGRR